MTTLPLKAEWMTPSNASAGVVLPSQISPPVNVSGSEDVLRIAPLRIVSFALLFSVIVPAAESP